MKKIIFLFFLSCSLWGQKKSIYSTELPDNLSYELISNNINTDNIRTKKIKPTTLAENGIDGFFLSYEKADTLTFDTLFSLYKYSSQDYISKGIAFYEKKNNTYDLKFANLNAFFCLSCNNAGIQDFYLHKDTLVIDIPWGPSIAPQFKEFHFIFNKKKQNWFLTSTISLGGNDAGSVSNSYYKILNPIISIKDFYAENSLAQFNQKAESISIGFEPGNFKKLLEQLKNIKEKNQEKYLEKILTEREIFLISYKYSYNRVSDIDYSTITLKNVQYANDCGYYLEQMNILNPAEELLKNVIRQFPDRMVAYLNLGDVYRKKKALKNATYNYHIYVNMMMNKGLSDKIPLYVLDYIN